MRDGYDTAFPDRMHELLREQRLRYYESMPESSREIMKRSEAILAESARAKIRGYELQADYHVRNSERLADPAIHISLARSDRFALDWCQIPADDAAELMTAWERSDSMNFALLAQQLSGGPLDIYPKREYDMLVRKAPRRRLVAEPSARYIPSDVRRAVWIRDGGRCSSCGISSDLQFDHIIPVAKGGSSTLSNIELLCSKCNRHKSDIIR